MMSPTINPIRYLILFAVITALRLSKEIDAIQSNEKKSVETISIPVRFVTSNQKKNGISSIPLNFADQTVAVSNLYPADGKQRGTQPQSYNTLTISEPKLKKNILVPCSCAVYLTGQFVLGSNSQPKGNPALTHEHEESFPCNSAGSKQCTNKCLDVMVRHLGNSPTIICGTIDRDCYKERAYLWIKNCNDSWVNTNLSAGKDYCCKNGLPYKCPLKS